MSDTDDAIEMASTSAFLSPKIGRTPSDHEKESTQLLTNPPSPTTALTSSAHLPTALASKLPPKVNPDNIVFDALFRHGKLTLEQLAKEVAWESNFEEDYGDLRSFLISYKVLFLINPATSEVVLRRSRRPKSLNRPMTLQLMPEYHSCAYTSVCEQFDLDILEGIYKRRGLVTSLLEGVLVVRFEGFFEMFLFRNGAVVWWGANREDHWIVEDDFTDLNCVSEAAVINRHSLSDINTLYPKWSTYRVDASMDMVPGEDNTEVFATFRERLELDHFRIPANSKRFPNAETESKMAISFAMAAASKADFFEHVTLATGDQIGTMTSKTGLWEHLVGSKRLSLPWMLEGELRNAQLMMAFITDEPDFLWEKPYLHEFVSSTMDLFSVESRREFFNNKCDAQFQLIDSITERRHRIFMMRSDFFLIIILALDVCVLLIKLTMVMYMKGSPYYREWESE